MKRRRAILAVAALAVVFAAAWWAFDDRLSTAERRLVGTWRKKSSEESGWSVWMLGHERGALRVGGPGGVFACVFFDSKGRWSYSQGTFLFDEEPDKWRRAFRPLLQRLGISVCSPAAYRVEILAADQIALVELGGSREVWTRVSGD
jgi:hypothetical protein